VKPAEYHIPVYQGEDKIIVISFPFDLSTMTEIKTEIRSAANASVLATFTIGNGFTISGTGNEILTWKISHEQSLLLPINPNKYAVYDLKLTDEVGNVNYYIYGKIVVTPRITQ
jgi:hypothetical protein